MQRNYLSYTLLAASLTLPALAADLTPLIPPRPASPFSEIATRRAVNQAAYRKWKISLAPVLASQSLDVASSYGMRELNPILAGPNGRFGAQGAGIKLGATAAALGIEYLIVRKHPRFAGILSKINWSISIVTTGFAAHNFAVR